MTDKRAALLVEKHIFAAAGLYGKALVTDKRRDLVRVSACGIDNEFCRNFSAVLGFYKIAAGLFFNRHHLKIKVERGSVVHSVADSSHAKLVGTNDSSRRRVKRVSYLVADIRLN